MNVNTAVLTDVMVVQPTAPSKESSKTMAEASGKNFQQVMEQYTGRKETAQKETDRKETVKKENWSAETQKTPVTDQGTVTAKKDDSRTNSGNKSLNGSQNSQNEKLPQPAVPEEKQKAEEARLQAMLALAEPVMVQVISPEMLMEVVGEGSMEGQNIPVADEASSLNVQSANQGTVPELVNQEMAGAVWPELMVDAASQNLVTNASDQKMMAVNDSLNPDQKGTGSVSQDVETSQPTTVETSDPRVMNVAKMSDQPASQVNTGQSLIHDTTAIDGQNPVSVLQNQEAPSKQTGAETENISDSGVAKSFHAEMAVKQPVQETENQTAGQNRVETTGEPTGRETLNGTLKANGQNLVNQSSSQELSEKLSTGKATTQPVPESGDPAQANTMKSQIDAHGTGAEPTMTFGQQSEIFIPKSQINVSGTEVNVSEKGLNSQAAIQNPVIEAAGQETTPKTSQWDMSSKTADENLQSVSQSTAVTPEKAVAVQPKELQLNAQQALSEAAQGTAAGQAATDTAPVISETFMSRALDQARQTTANAVSAENPENTVIQKTVTASASGQSSTADDTESGFGDMLKDQSALDGTARSSFENEAAGVKGQVSALSKEQASLEELKKNAEAKGINLMDRMAEARITGGAKVQTMNQTAGQNASSVVTQVKEGLEQGVKNQLKEFTIHLKPEGLGEVIVKMVSQDGKLTVNIGASSSETQKLINSQMVSLKEMLEPLHAEVGEVYHSSQDATGFLNYDQNTPENQRQQAGHYQGSQHYDNYTEDEEILTEAEYITAQRNLARLYTYV